MQLFRMFAAIVMGFAALWFNQPHAAAAKMVFQRGNAAEPDTLDPALTSSTWESHIVGDLFLGLTTEDPQAHPIPAIAESWTVTPDGLTWTFKLRKGMVWSDGVPVKASDVAFSMRRLVDPKTASKYASMLYVVVNAEEINAGKKPVDQLGVRVIDPSTFEMKLTQPAPFLAGLLMHSSCHVVPEHVVTKFGKEWTKPDPFLKQYDWAKSLSS